MEAWRGWYHVVGNTYGTWLRGDPRGWRSRKHREHVEGDYRHPPAPGAHQALYEHSQRFLKQPPVYLSAGLRRTAGESFVAKLLGIGIEVLALSLDATHYHLLGRFGSRHVRRCVGRAKMHASMVLSHEGLKGTVWAKRCRPAPIRDRQHQINTFRYIAQHADKGAWVWTFRQPPLPPHADT